MPKAIRNRTGRKLIVLGQVPPPLHGQAVAIASMIEGLEDRMDLVHVPMRFSDTVFDNGRLKFQKIVHLFQIIARTVWLMLRNRGAVLYYPPAPASWVPVIRDLLILSIVRPLSASTVFHFHAHGIGKFLQDHKWLRRLTWAWRKPACAVVLGESCVEDTQILNPDSVSIVPYGVDIAAAVRKRPKDGKLVVLYVGMLAESKGLFDLLETANRLRDLEVEFRLVGTYKGSDTQPRFEGRRAELGLEQRVITVGKKSGQELWQEYADADLFFFPTFFETETFGVVVLEAMAHRLPVVAARWRGPMDIVVDGQTGLLCDSRNIDAYEQSIRQLFGDEQLRSRMGQNGLRLCRENYSLNSYLDAMKSIFVDLGVREV